MESCRIIREGDERGRGEANLLPAAAAVPGPFWAGAFYRQQRAKGNSYQAAVRALAFKWIHILYRCWQTGTRYDESTYLNALRKRGSPVLANITVPPLKA